MTLASFYHVWADGLWRDPLLEHLQVFERAKLWNPRFGIVGSAANRACVKDEIVASWGERYDYEIAVEADGGFEQVTLERVRAYAQEEDGAVLYAHTKGASNAGEIGSNALWRRAMTRQVVENWRANLAAMEEYDALGCHWLTQENTPDSVMIRSPFFAGNFWMARCDYLAQLPECSTADRMEAELWVGQCNPRVRDVLPGWPAEHRWTSC